MSTVGEVSPSSFDSYEGIRIVIPGLLALGVGIATFSTVAPDENLGLLDNTLVGLVAGLAIGLFFYFWDVPARSAAYYENQPTDFLEKKYPDEKSFELLTAYLLLLNTKMPSNTRNRSLYMGSMYRIGVEMILSLGVATYVVFAASLFNYGPPTDTDSHLPRIISALTLVLVSVFCFAINHGYERRIGETYWKTTVRIRERFLRDIWRLATLPFAAGLLMILIPNLSLLIDGVGQNACRTVALLGMSLCLGHWCFRYVRGYAELGNARRRVRLHSTASGFLFVTPIVVSLLTWELEHRSILGQTSLVVAWTSVACLVLMTVVIRGHERKLHGVYRGQTRWLEENPDETNEAVYGNLVGLIWTQTPR